VVKKTRVLFTLPVDTSSHAVSGIFSVNKRGNQINVNFPDYATSL